MICTKKINSFLCKELSKTTIDTISVSVLSSNMRQERILEWQVVRRNTFAQVTHSFFLFPQKVHHLHLLFRDRLLNLIHLISVIHTVVSDFQRRVLIGFVLEFQLGKCLWQNLVNVRSQNVAFYWKRFVKVVPSISCKLFLFVLCEFVVFFVVAFHKLKKCYQL